MKDINEILARLSENEKITRKFTEIEISILTILNFKDLFEVLLTQIQDKFMVPYAWICLVDSCEIPRLLSGIDTSKTLKQRLTILDRDSFLKITKAPQACILANRNLKPYFKLLPEKQKFFIKSIAIVPLFLYGELIGSFNLADFSQERFSPGIDTSALDQLGLKVSLCLSNVTSHEKLRFLSYHDPLTGVLSHRMIDSVLEREFSKAKRYDTPLALALLDVDHFKRVNSTLGHELGDDVLKYVSQQLKQSVRKCDTLFRFGTNTFVVMLPNTNAANAKQIMLRFQKLLAANPFRKNMGILKISVSIEVVSTEETAIKSHKQLLLKAQEHLHQTKKIDDSRLPLQKLKKKG